jgi:mannose-1-phosphate guanylyltransferase
MRSRDIDAVILLGGLGTRLRPYTLSIPKPLLPVCNTPLINYQFALLEKYGIRRIILCLSYQYKKFYNYLKNSILARRFEIIFHTEDTPLGTGGALGSVKRYIKSLSIIFNGDILTDVNLCKLVKFHMSKNADVTIALTRVKDPTSYGLVVLNNMGYIKQFIEKPSWEEVITNTINAGIYIFNPYIYDCIPENKHLSLEREVFPALLNMGKKVCGYIFNSYWIDIGTPEKYFQAHADLLSQKVNIPYYNKRGRGKNIYYTGENIDIDDTVEIKGNLCIGGKSKIEKYTWIEGNVSIGACCHIGRGVFLKDCIILNNVSIGDGCKIENSIIGNKCKIFANAKITNFAIIGDNSVVTNYSNL